MKRIRTEKFLFNAKLRLNCALFIKHIHTYARIFVSCLQIAKWHLILFTPPHVLHMQMKLCSFFFFSLNCKFSKYWHLKSFRIWIARFCFFFSSHLIEFNNYLITGDNGDNMQTGCISNRSVQCTSH